MLVSALWVPTNAPNSVWNWMVAMSVTAPMDMN